MIFGVEKMNCNMTHKEKVEEGIRLLEDIARKIYDDDRRHLAMYTIGAICNRLNIKEEEE